MKNILIVIFVTAIFYTAWLAGAYPKAFIYVDTAFGRVEKILDRVQEQVAAVLHHKPVTVEELQRKYTAPWKNVRILIIPGHEPDYGGTEFGSLKERELNVDLAMHLGQFLKDSGRYDVMLTRDNREWSPVLTQYFSSQWQEIEAFFRDNKEDALHKIRMASLESPPARNEAPVKRVYHNSAPRDVALRLYGINKWGNENAVDIALHVHFNDYPRDNPRREGKYSGFAVYVPERAYYNSTTTRAIAGTIFKRLAKYNAVSNFPNEDDGIVEEPELIAIGAYNTANSASMLIEYGYIYEPQFQDPAVRESTIKDLAFQTYLGLQDFFGDSKGLAHAYDTLMLPYSWKGEVMPQSAPSYDVLALQSALLVDGLYPGDGKTKNDCPRTGRMGICTLGALAAFQKKYGIEGENGYVGERTRKLLNEKYSTKPK